MSKSSLSSSSKLLCHSSNKKKKHIEGTCSICGDEYCLICLNKFRFPKEDNSPNICISCFPNYLYNILYPNEDFNNIKTKIHNYLLKTIFCDKNNKNIEDIDTSESSNNNNNDIINSINESIPGFITTKEKKPKLSMKTKVLDKVAMGLIRMSGMYEGGELNRSYIERASRRKVKYIDNVGKIEKHTISVPYRYSTEDYNFEEYNIDPNIVLEPIKDNEPEFYDLVVKVYYFKDPKEYDELQPVLIWFHGGGFVMGNVDDSVLNRTMSRLANMIQGIIVSVNYRLAPEFKWPTQPEDAYSILTWVYNKGEELLKADKNLISIGGDSAGGNLAAVIPIMSKLRNGPPIIHHVSIYPGLNCEEFNTESYKNYGNGPFLRMGLLRWFKNQYLYAPKSNCGYHPFVSPLLANIIDNLPPLTIITAGYCPLTDHAKEYALRFYNNNIPITYTEYSKSFHAFYHSYTHESVEAITQTGIIVKLYIDIASNILYGIRDSKNNIHNHNDNDSSNDNQFNDDNYDDESIVAEI